MKVKLTVLGFVLGSMLGVTPALADGKSDFLANCKSCHGEDGKGQTKMGTKLGVKDFTNPATQKDFTDEKALQAILDGIKDPKTGKDKMKGYKDKLSPDQAKAIVQYLRTLAAK